MTRRDQNQPPTSRPLAEGGDADVPTDLPVLVLNVDRYRAAGLRDVTLRVYPGARHELFNELNRAEVISDLLAWLGAPS